jgi:putative hydrolase of the HAD superfamily
MSNVIFDVGGVLLDWNPDRIIDACYADPVERAAMKEIIFQHDDWLELDRGALTEQQLLARVAQRARRPVPELDDLFDVVRASLQPKHDSIALLAALAERAVPLYCLTNMPPGTMDWLRQAHGFWQYFDGLVASGEVHLLKPDPAIFELLLDRYGLAAGETVFIDDNPPNIAAAQALGMRAILFKDAAQCAAELATTSVGALAPPAPHRDRRRGR